MDKNKICEALYALHGGAVVCRRKSPVNAVVLTLAGVLMIVLNNIYGDALTGDARSAIVAIGGFIALTGLVMLAVYFFGSKGAPYHSSMRNFLRYEEIYFDRGLRREVVDSVTNGEIERILDLDRSRVPAVAVAMYRSLDNRFVAMQAFEYADLEYKQVTGLTIVDRVGS